MGEFDGRVVVITGAGRGIGREHALLFGAEGARVVVNDLGPDADDPSTSAAEAVAAEVRARGGEAVARVEDIADWNGAERLIQAAIDAYDDIHVLVNNAGILRDRMLVSMTEAEWDDAVRVNLKGHFCPTRHAAAWWRERAKAGEPTTAPAVVNTTSGSGLLGNVGQANYVAAKAGVASLTIVLSRELERYGVRVNAVSPAARTRLTANTPGLSDLVKPPEEEGAPDLWDPAHISPLVAYLAAEHCPFTGRVFWVQGTAVTYYEGWSKGDSITAPGDRWTIEGLAKEMPVAFASRVGPLGPIQA